MRVLSVMKQVPQKSIHYAPKHGHVQIAEQLKWILQSAAIIPVRWPSRLPVALAFRIPLVVWLWKVEVSPSWLWFLRI